MLEEVAKPLSGFSLLQVPPAEPEATGYRRFTASLVPNERLAKHRCPFDCKVPAGKVAQVGTMARCQDLRC